ncbi:hypothetical protein GW915_09025 [bacterium]|nr:hypothetical protein [bacterium]
MSTGFTVERPALSALPKPLKHPPKYLIKSRPSAWHGDCITKYRSGIEVEVVKVEVEADVEVVL